MLPPDLFSSNGNLSRKVRTVEVRCPGPRVNHIARRGREGIRYAATEEAPARFVEQTAWAFASHHQVWVGSLSVRRKCPIFCQSTALTASAHKYEIENFDGIDCSGPHTSMATAMVRPGISNCIMPPAGGRYDRRDKG